MKYSDVEDFKKEKWSLADSVLNFSMPVMETSYIGITEFHILRINNFWYHKFHFKGTRSWNPTLTEGYYRSSHILTQESLQ